VGTTRCAGWGSVERTSGLTSHVVLYLNQPSGFHTLPALQKTGRKAPPDLHCSSKKAETFPLIGFILLSPPHPGPPPFAALGVGTP
jgi:hypothetical protein